jgi:8-oxo-dGTP pyrophosphatase MutT (NUDIX family)
MRHVIRQAAAIPFRVEPAGLRVLLITSRQTGRWVVPKGNIEKGFTAPQAAEQEAFEEAGIKGIIDRVPLGIYTYSKRMRSGRIKPASVEVFALQVIKQLKNWPEKGERRFEWMTPADAALAVHETGLAALFHRLHEMHGGDQPQPLPIAG